MEIRPTRRPDVAPGAALMARAFANEHPFVWIEPDADARLRFNQALFRAALGHLYPPGSGPEVAVEGGDIVGCAIWSRSGVRPSVLQQAGAAITMIRGAGLAGLRSAGPRGTALEEALQSARPQQPHWLLVGIAVKPEIQGKGVGAALLRHGLERSERDGLSAYLECLEPLVPYYERHGFCHLHWIDMPEGAARQAGMLREPAAATK